MSEITIRLNPAKDKRDSVGYIIDSLHEIRTNPNHNFPQEEVDRLEALDKEFSESVSKINNPIFNLPSAQEFRENITKFNFDLFQRLTRLTKRGWYISPDIVRDYPIDKLIELTEDENLESFENQLIEMGDTEVSFILNNCIVSLQNREHIWKELLVLYESKYYHGLITLAYSQADGICNDFWGHSLYWIPNKGELGDKNSNVKLHENLDGKFDGFLDATIQQLGIPYNEITVKTRGNPDFDDKLLLEKTFNRHKVMHGQSLFYGSKMNAIRSIFLLDYLRFISENCKPE